MLLYYQGFRWTRGFRSRGYREVAGGKGWDRAPGYLQRLQGREPGRGQGHCSQCTQTPSLLSLETSWCYLTEQLLERSRYFAFQWESAVINRRLIGPFIKSRTCPQVTWLSKLLPTLQVLDWQTYYSSPNGLQKILYGKMIYFQEGFYCACAYPECGKILLGPSFFMHQRGWLIIRITESNLVSVRRTLTNRAQPGHFTDGKLRPGQTKPNDIAS